MHSDGMTQSILQKCWRNEAGRNEKRRVNSLGQMIMICKGRKGTRTPGPENSLLVARL